MPTHHAIATTALLPIGVPISSPRRVSMMGVKGWYSANQRSAAGIVSVGTNPLLRNGRMSNGMGMLLAVSTLFARRPRATHSHVIAKVTIARNPATAIHSRSPAVGRNPMATATPMTTTRLSAVWIMAPRT